MDSFHSCRNSSFFESEYAAIIKYLLHDITYFEGAWLTSNEGFFTQLNLVTLISHFQFKHFCLLDLPLIIWKLKYIKQ